MQARAPQTQSSSARENTDQPSPQLQARSSGSLQALEGLLLGTAVGDALGLPLEGLSPLRARRLFGDGPLSHRLLLGHGMVSDDTEHACMTAQALLAARGDPQRFARSLAWRLRLWFLGLPAGLGLATLRSILRLWIGFSPAKSGVWSAGNGPAMRAPILGVCLGDDPEQMRAFVRASTRLTHSDPRAYEGALVVARAAYLSAHAPFTTRTGVEEDAVGQILERLMGDVEGEELRANLTLVGTHLQKGSSPATLAQELGLESGVTGYINHTVPVAIFCWLRSPTNFRRALCDVIALGGDADTTGAIAGALVGAATGPDSIPQEWRDGLLEWPRSRQWMHSLAMRLAENDDAGPLAIFWPGIIIRNALFTATVLTHGFRRLFPPY